MTGLLLARPRRFVAGSVTVGAPLLTSALRLGFTSTHHEDDGDMNDVGPTGRTPKQLLGDTVDTAALHVLGFASSIVDPWPVEASATRAWATHDLRFGYDPGGDPDVAKAAGWYAHVDGPLTLTACGCPRWMRKDPLDTRSFNVTGSPPVGAYANTGGQWPIGTPSNDDLNLLSKYQPPWPSHNAAYAQLVVEFLLRYPQVGYLQVWNEFKGYYANGLNRWWHEGYTALYNAVWDAVRAVPALDHVGIIGPYMVFKALTWDVRSKWDTRLDGPWGYSDETVLDAYNYWAANAHGADYVGIDIRNNGSDFERGDFLLSAVCNTTSGSAVVSSPDGPVTNLPRQFNADDAGKRIEGPGIPAGATILTRDSPTQITLSVPATATATGVVLTYGDVLTRTITDAVIANDGPGGKATVTSASAPFTGADDNRNVSGPGIPIGATIDTVNSATKVTLTDAATATGTGLRVTWGNWPYETAYYWPTDPWTAAEKIHDVVAYFASLGGLLGTRPLWINEWYANPYHWLDLLATGEAVSSEQEQLSVIAWALAHYVRAGVTGLILWRPQSEGATIQGNPLALWVETTKAPTSLHPLLSFVREHLSAGSTIYECDSTRSDVLAIASDTGILVVSKASTPRTVRVDGAKVRLGPYAVEMIVR